VKDISHKKKGKLYINNIKNIPITKKNCSVWRKESMEGKGKESHKKV